MLRRMILLVCLILFFCATDLRAATYYVRQDGGDLACDGMTDAAAGIAPPACAFLTVQRGVDAASTPGDRVVIHGGTYFESVSVGISGAASANTIIEGYPGEAVIIDSGLPAFRTIGNNDWELVDASLGEYRSVAGYPANRVYAYIDGVAGYENGRVGLMHYTDTRAEPGGGLPGYSMFRAATDVYVDANTPLYVGPGMWLGKACFGGSSPDAACEISSDCPGSGICAPTSWIHIRLSRTADMRLAEARYGAVLAGEDADPRNYSIIVSLAGSTMRVYGSYLEFRNLTFNQAEKTIRLEGGAHHLTFDDVTVWTGSTGISAAQPIDPPHDILITRSRIFGDSPYWIFWSDAKDPPFPAIRNKGTHISLNDGAHDVEVSYSHVRGGFDGVGTNTSEYNISLHHNRVENFKDDAFEIEGAADIGRVSVYESYIANCLNGFAPGQASPLVTGPISFYRNVVSLLRDPPVNRAPGINAFNGGFRHGFEYAFKQHSPNTFYYNNTVILLNSYNQGVNLVPGNAGEQADTYIVNNVYVKVNGRVQGSYLTGPGQIVDHNLYWKMNSSDPGPLAGGYDTIADLATATGLEPNGIGATPRVGTDPQFSAWGLSFDTSVPTRWSLSFDQEVWSTSDFLLDPMSPAIGAGMPIPVHPAFGLLPDSRPSQEDLGAIPSTASASEWGIFPFDQGWRGPVNAPDLVQLQLSEPPAVLLLGDSFAVTDTVSERGPMAAGGAITRFYLSADRLRGGPDLALGTRTVPDLGVGAASTGTTSIFIPTGVAPGSYYLVACADDTDLIPESIETNNCRASSGQVRVTASDLLVTAVLDPATTVAAGTTFSATDTAANQGDAAAQASTTRYYLSVDTLRDAADTLLTGGRTVPGLPPGGAATATVTVAVPATTRDAGYYLLACADDMDLVLESDETNNCRASSGQVRVIVPDLVEAAVTDPLATVPAGSSFSVNDTVVNLGSAAAGGSTTRYHLSIDASKDDMDTLLPGTRSVSSLASLASSTGTVTVTIPTATREGSYLLLACADDKASVVEGDETNNCRASAAAVFVTVPDLAQTAVSSPPASAMPGESFSVTDTATNVGSAASRTTATRYHLSVEPTKDATGMVLSGSRSVSSLPAAASSTGTTIVTIPLGTRDGTYHLLACADDLSAMVEITESNNCLAAAGLVQVTGPDLVEATVTEPPATVPQGRTFTVTDTASSVGLAASGSSTTRYFLSVDRVKNSSDKPLTGSRSVPGLTPAALSAGSVIVTVPSSTAPAAYFLIACADAYGAVAESDESNNCLASTGLVEVAVPNQVPLVSAGPDLILFLPAGAALDGTVSDDGLPAPPAGAVTTVWSLDSGPGAVTFADAAALDTTASFSTAGIYVLRLTADDGDLTTADTVTITTLNRNIGLTLVESRVAAGSDDAEETALSMSLTSADIELVSDGSIQQVGMRFNGLAIPRGASIESAYIQFKADETQSEATSLTIQAQAADSPLAFTSTAGNISTRSRTAAAVAWAPPAWTIVGQVGPDQRTPDISSLIQEVVSRPGWLSGNSMVLLITGSGHRTAESFEGDSAGAPLLHIELAPSTVNQTPSVSAGPDQTISLPADVALDGAVSDEGLPSPPSTVTTLWSVDSGPGTVTFADATAVDTIASFSAAGTYVLRLTADDSELTAGDTVTIMMKEPGLEPVIVESRVVGGSDDAEEKASLSMSLTSGDIEMVYDGSIQQVGMRFNGLAIPRGASIESAYIQFKAGEAQSEATSLTIQVQAADSPPGFTSTAGNISTRTRTAAAVVWAPPAWTNVGQVGPDQRTPDISALIREVVSRPGWLSGNSIVILITGSGHRTAEAFEGDATGAPLLHIELTICNAPGPVSNLRIDADGQSLSWDPAASGAAYDVVRGGLLQLGEFGGDFTAAQLECMVSRGPWSWVQDPQTPSSNNAFFYLVRGVGCSGLAGTYDDSVDISQAGSRDPGIQASPGACR